MLGQFIRKEGDFCIFLYVLLNILELLKLNHRLGGGGGDTGMSIYFFFLKKNPTSDKKAKADLDDGLI